MPTRSSDSGPELALEFVTFHVGLGSAEAVHPNQTLKHKEYLSMIDMMFASAGLFHPGARKTVLTDRRTDTEGLPQDVRVVRFDIDPAKLMLERAQAQLSHVRQGLAGHPMVILDSDILINSSLLHVFHEHDFDVAVTWRPDDTMPINGGLLILNHVRPGAAIRFFDRFVGIYRERYADRADWFGDQLALRDCLGIGPDGLADNRLLEVDGCRVLLLSCDTYNFSPRNQWNEVCSPLPEKVVLHFKGKRKRLMGFFWKGWLRPKSSYLPWIHLVGWRERRRLRRRAAAESRRAGMPAGENE